MKKILLAAVAVVLIVVISVSATFAYLTSQDVAENTFTVGNIEITLDETDVDEYGQPVAGAARVEENDYKLLPGHTYTKDPTVTVLKGSEEAYVRVLVKVSNIKALESALGVSPFTLESISKDVDTANWEYIGITDDGAFEYRYKKSPVDASGENKVLEPLFKTITIPGEVDKESLAELEGLKIDIVAQAIQAKTFNGNEDDAWAKFTTPQA